MQFGLRWFCAALAAAIVAVSNAANAIEYLKNGIFETNDFSGSGFIRSIPA